MESVGLSARIVPAVMGKEDVRQRGIEKICCHRAKSQTRGHTDRPDSHAAWPLIDHRFPGMKLHTCVEEDNSISLPLLYSR